MRLSFNSEQSMLIELNKLKNIMESNEKLNFLGSFYFINYLKWGSELDPYIELCLSNCIN